MKPFDFDRLNGIPSHREILDLLNAIRSLPGVSVDTEGRSRQGRELFFCAIGNGPHVIGVTSGAHADEPVGIATTVNFIRELTATEAHKDLLGNYTFAIFPMLDPDGSAVNEVWTNDLSYKSYFLHSYRNNQPAEDCEHGIPVFEDQGIRPEVAFFKKHIDRFQGHIEFYVTLHTTHVLGGSLFVVDRDFQEQDIIRGLTGLCDRHHLPLWDYRPRGEATLTYIAPGFIGAPSVESYAEELKNAPTILATMKMSTYEYVLHRCGGRFALISELPMYLTGGDLASLEETDVPLIDLKRKSLESGHRIHEQRLKDLGQIKSFEPEESNPWYKAALFAAKAAPEGMKNQESHLPRYEGLKAQKYEVAVEDLAPMENELKRHRLFIKILEGLPGTAGLVKEHRTAFDSLVEQYERRVSPKPVSLRRQVEIQTGMILEGQSYAAMPVRSRPRAKRTSSWVSTA